MSEELIAATGACWDNLITSFPNEHRALTNHHINELTKTREDGLLDVRHTILFADSLDARLHVLVRAHGHVREHVMFNLVVQPAVHEIVHVTTSLEVRRTNHRTKVEVIRSRLSLSLETVDVISDVVGGDDDERVHVGDDVGEHGRHPPSERRLRAADRVTDGR